MKHKIEFCNGYSKCGCRLSMTDGGGMYSDSVTVYLCLLHQPKDDAAEVLKDVEKIPFRGDGSPEIDVSFLTQC